VRLEAAIKPRFTGTSTNVVSRTDPSGRTPLAPMKAMSAWSCRSVSSVMTPTREWYARRTRPPRRTSPPAAQLLGQELRGCADVEQNHVAVPHHAGRCPCNHPLIRRIDGGDQGEGPVDVGVLGATRRNVRTAVDAGELAVGLQPSQVAADGRRADPQ
jgi:hypothetical protein